MRTYKKLFNIMNNVLTSLIKQFMPFAQKEMGFDRTPKLFLKHDNDEANNPMGKTGFYEPDSESITIYIGNRHPKDVMRSLSHELMHHTQKCNGDFDSSHNMGEQGYAQSDGHLRNMEIQAYQASIVFRDWEDSTKGTIYYEHLQKGAKTMSTKDWKNKEISTLLSEAWGFKFSSLQEFDEFNGTGEIQEEGTEEIKEGEDQTSQESAEQDCAKKGRKWNTKLAKCDTAKVTTDEAVELDEELDEQTRTDSPDRARPAGGRRLDEEDEEDDQRTARKQRKDREAHQRKIREGDDEEAIEEKKDELKEAIKELLGRYLKG